MTIQTFVSELGTDMTRWPTEDHLVSWLKLAPCRQISGGRVIKQARSPSKNRVAEALRMAASTLVHSASYLARLMYRMLTHGQAWVDRGAQEHEQKRVAREKQSLLRKAAALGYRLEPAA